MEQAFFAAVFVVAAVAVAVAGDVFSAVLLAEPCAFVVIVVAAAVSRLVGLCLLRCERSFEWVLADFAD